MDDDLNTPAAFGALFSFVKQVNSMIDSNSLGKGGAEKALDALRRVNSVLGVMTFESEQLPPRLAALVAQRDLARKKKDFAESDRIRKELLSEGVVVEDTPSGTRWKRASRG